MDKTKLIEYLRKKEVEYADIARGESRTASATYSGKEEVCRELADKLEQETNESLRIENIEIDKEGKDVIHAEIEYPRSNQITTISIGLTDVRAADNIRISYDFDRDGWVIYQSRVYHPQIEENSYGCEIEWIESAFCPAWKYELPEEEKFKYKIGDEIIEE